MAQPRPFQARPKMSLWHWPMTLGLLFLTVQGFGKTYLINPHHSQIGFSLDFMGDSKIIGHVQEFYGQFNFDPTTKLLNAIEVNSSTASIITGDSKRDGRIKEQDLFYVRRYPWAKFQSKKVEMVSAKKYLVYGELSIKEFTRPLELQVEFLASEHENSGDENLFFSFQTALNREEYNLIWNRPTERTSWLVGQMVELKGRVQASAQGPKDEYATQVGAKEKARDYTPLNVPRASPVIPTPALH